MHEFQIHDTDSDYIPASNSSSELSKISYDINFSPQISPIIPVSASIVHSENFPISSSSCEVLKVQPIAISTEIEVPSSSITTKRCNNMKIILNPNENKRVRRKHTCPFCDLPCGNFSRHLERNHDEEVSVQEFMCLQKNSKKRKKLIDKIRREGDFCSSSIVPVMQQERDINDFIVCKFCKGYYSKKSLRRHVKHCFFNPDPTKRFNAQVEGHTVMAGNFGPKDILRTSGLLNMLRADDVSMVAKKDHIICEVARRYIRRHKQKHLLMVAKRQMRRLARLLIAIRRLSNNVYLKLIDILTPMNFKRLAEATKEISGYNEMNRSFSSPSLALQMGTIIKNAIDTAYSLEIQRPDSSSQHLENLKNLTVLMKTDWAHEVSSEAGQNLLINKFNKPSLIPMAKNIAVSM